MKNSDNSIIDSMYSFGEDVVVGRVYVQILLNGPVTVKDIAEQTNLNLHYVNRAVERLLLYPLITLDINREHNAIYHPLPPKSAFKAIETNAIWQTKYILRHNGSTKATYENAYLNTFVSLCRQLSNLSEKIYKGQSAIKIEMVQVAQSRDQMVGMISETICSSNREVLCIVSPPHLLGPIVWVAVSSRIQEGLNYKRITVITELIRHGLKITYDEIYKYGVNLYYVDPSQITQQFYVIDEHIVIFFYPSKTIGNYEFTGQKITNRKLGVKYKEEFEGLLKTAVPAYVALKYISNVKQKVLKKAKVHLNSMELIWLENVIDYGVFNKKRLPIHKEIIAIKRAMSANLVKIVDNDIICNIDIVFKDIYRYWESINTYGG